MANGNLSSINNFYENKSVLRPYRFDVDLKWSEDTDMPKIESHHVISVTLNGIAFKKENGLMPGFVPRSLPVINTDGLELSIVFEEDEKATITKLSHWLQRKNISADGTYTYPGKFSKNQIIVTIFENEVKKGTTDMKPLMIYTFYNCFLLSSTSPVFDYGGAESVKYTLVFNSDYYDINFLNDKLKI